MLSCAKFDATDNVSVRITREGSNHHAVTPNLSSCLMSLLSDDTSQNDPLASQQDPSSESNSVSTCSALFLWHVCPQTPGAHFCDMLSHVLKAPDHRKAKSAAVSNGSRVCSTVKWFGEIL